MVKKLDERDWPDHMGYRLWLAYRTWHQEFVREMHLAGHGWFTDSRATLLGHLPRTGIAQSKLIDRVGISKQAIQQLLDGLESDGIVVRVPDPSDKRSKLINYTDKGLVAIADSNRVKRQIDRRLEKELGLDAVRTLMRHLATIASQAPPER